MGTQLPATWRRLKSEQERDTRQRRRARAAVRANLADAAGAGVAPLDPINSARVAGLRHVNDERMPGIRRIGQKTRVRYIGPDGRSIKDAAELQRIRALAIPPAWVEVWICPHANGHLQATGRDARGRKQYRYHGRWREVRDEVKYGRLISFAQALPRIRERTDADLRRPDLPREKVLAAVVQLLEKTLIRVGNEEYARDNGSIGLTTMRDGHAKIQGAKVRFEFRGKSGIEHAIDLDDRRLARIVQACRDLPGYELFQYVDEQGARQEIDSADVNLYLREISGEDFSAKDFRTWAGTVLAAQALAAVDRYSSTAEAKRNVVKAIESVAKRLGNTKAVCRKSYVHPAILDAYLDGGTIQTIEARARLVKTGPALSAAESAVVRMIEQRLRKKTA
jgi:DNA topoisomerase-1